ncbi:MULTISPECIES: DapH/DapD/GlmU-related protein [Hymenobacter]|uniref:Hexapeptide repeat of succinyl-transferase n=1 Tax=Hymenobacter mucosus TaxID=1411120 RepID=A0A239AIV5_9BACT|nr:MULTISPECIES: DapH/DapD/GlmU-related protein [Hymenobacter]SNR95575.1 Hexapeptide repeat of succinyl-transferase [Hymenobacter mucosus]
MTGTVLTADITLEEGVLINLNCAIGHNCVIGTGAVMLLGVKIGVNPVVGAGSVVTKDVEPYSLVVGTSARVVCKLHSPVAP